MIFPAKFLREQKRNVIRQNGFCNFFFLIDILKKVKHFGGIETFLKLNNLRRINIIKSINF